MAGRRRRRGDGYEWWDSGGEIGFDWDARHVGGDKESRGARGTTTLGQIIPNSISLYTVCMYVVCMHLTIAISP